MTDAYTDSEVQHLADVLTDAHMRGIRNGHYTLARTILDAGYRRPTGEPRADGTIRDDDGKPLIRVTTMPDLPPGVVVVASPVQPDEVLPGETVAEAMVRLRRAVVLHTTPAGEGSEASRD